MKKIFSAILLCMLLMCLAFSALAVGPAVIDQADLFTPAQEQQLTALIETFREKYEMDFGIVTSADPHGDVTQQEIADDLYDRGGYGIGEYANGILYYIDMYERIPYLCTTGEMIDYMTDERIEAAHDAVYHHLVDGNYAGAAEAMIGEVSAYMRKGIPEGQYRYDVITGERLTSFHKSLTPGEILFGLIGACIVMFIYTGSVKGSYKLRGKTYEYDYISNSSVTITDQVDEYVRTTRTVSPKAPPPSASSGGSGRSSGGSGVHVSSSGHSHGGGAGRKF
jgi:uncharacterized protein